MTEPDHRDPPTEDPTPIDPETLRDREGIEYAERTYTHESEDHCESDAVGRAVVGVTDDEGRVLLLVHASGSHAILPNATVDPDERFRAVARGAVADDAGVSAVIDGPVAVRRVEHLAGDADDPHSVTHHVLFAASPDGEADPATGDADLTAGWHDSMPVEFEEAGDVVDDVRRFLD